MSYMIETTLWRGEKKKSVTTTFGGTHRKLCKILGHHHKLTRFQIDHLERHNELPFTTKNGEKAQVRIHEVKMKIRNTRQAELPFMIVLDSGEQINWNGLSDETREEFKKLSPKMYEEIEQQRAEADEARRQYYAEQSKLQETP